MKSKELKIYNLPAEKILSAKINARPTSLFLIFILIGIISLLIGIPIVYGVGLIIVGATCIYFMPRVTLIEFYDDYLVLHNKADHDACKMIYYDDVKGWYYSWGATRDYLVIELQDENVEKLEAFSKPLFELYMYRYLKDKHINKKEK